MKKMLISLFCVSLFLLTPQISAVESQTVTQDIKGFVNTITYRKENLLKELRQIINVDSDILVALIGTIIYMILLTIVEVFGYGLQKICIDSGGIFFHIIGTLINFYTILFHIGLIGGHLNFVLKFMNDSDDVWCILLFYVVILYSLLIQEYMIEKWTPSWRTTI